MKSSGRKTVKAASTSAPRASKAGARKTTPAATDAVATTAAVTTAPAQPVIPTHDQIALRSYELYLARGAGAGHDVEDWLQAEAELKN
jgi:hypothetical protein